MKLCNETVVGSSNVRLHLVLSISIERLLFLSSKDISSIFETGLFLEAVEKVEDAR